MFSVNYNSLDVVKTLIDVGADIMMKDKYGQTAYDLAKNETIKKILNVTADLLKAAQKSDTTPQKIKAFIKLGANVNARNNDGMTVLMLNAINNPNSEDIKILVAAGADLNAKTRNGSTALMLAAEKCKTPDIMKVLIALSADVNTSDDKGRTALMRAVSSNASLENIKALIEAGANLN